MTSTSSQPNAIAPEINRRRFLLNTTITAASVAVANPSVAMPAANDATPAVSPAIEIAFKAITEARQELVAAKDARDWLADEWRHLWPRAPESMRLNGSFSGTVETDIVDRSYRDSNGRPKGIRTRKEVAESRAWVEGHKPPRASASARVQERHAKWRRDRLAEVQEMEAYLDTTEKLREDSGARAVLARIKAADEALDRSISSLMETPAVSLSDLQIKAQAALIAGDASGMNADKMKLFPILDASFSVVLDVLALTKGGAA
jgi:hypothetical protein